MFFVVTCLLFDKNNKLLIYLRDDNPAISYPNCWDLFGGMIEEGEPPEQALVREVQEELDIKLTSFTKFGEYDCLKDEARPNKKFVFYAHIDAVPEQLVLHEGQRLTSIYLHERRQYRFANILGEIIDDFAERSLKAGKTGSPEDGNPEISGGSLGD